ncbi:hypothetical protein GCM10009733_023000 [Nonomuraea maheshkhaliensis]|uniref:Abortive infection protein n=1 Tax=Nonomuraea maheshkhaliensis TaxID=419590 RepID=A0ABN2F1A9_9ACTN
MRGKGIHYDTGTRVTDGWSRPAFDVSDVRRDMRAIARELHCTAVRVTGSDPGRLTIAAEQAAEAGLEVWFAPFPCDLTTGQLLPLFAECADRAEALRRGGASVVLVTGGELSMFCHGFLPGDDFLTRIALFTGAKPDPRERLAALPARINAFLAEAADTVRARFGGKITYASLPFERVDWAPFDYVAADAYRAARNAATFREEIRDLHRHGRPVVITEFGCCTYRGAADKGGAGFLIVDRDHEPWRLDGHYERDEDGQAAYLRDLLRVFEEEGVDTAFWYTFASYRYPHHADPRFDLDLAAFGLVRVDPDLSLRPKAAFHALAAEYGEERR